jgi:predicted transcriptional regulator
MAGKNNQSKRKVHSRIFKFYSGLEVTFDALKDIIVKELKQHDGMTTGEIGKAIGIDPKQLLFVMPALSEDGDIDVRLNINSAFYFIPNECMLQNIYHPKPNFGDRVLSITKHRFR